MFDKNKEDENSLEILESLESKADEALKVISSINNINEELKIIKKLTKKVAQREFWTIFCYGVAVGSCAAALIILLSNLL
jgi:hypothetical protein